MESIYATSERERINSAKKLNHMYKYSGEDKKKPHNYDGEYFRFETRIDLSGGVKITPRFVSDYGYKQSQLLQDIGSFMAHWMLEIYHDVNGFSGTDTIKWNLDMKGREFDIDAGGFSQG